MFRKMKIGGQTDRLTLKTLRQKQWPMMWPWQYNIYVLIIMDKRETDRQTTDGLIFYMAY